MYIKKVFYCAFALMALPITKLIELCGCLVKGTGDGSLAADCSYRSDFNMTCLAMLELSSFDLSGNGLRRVPNITGFETVTDFNLSYNNITELASCNLFYMPRLKTLNLSHNSIEKLSSDVCSIPNIDLSFNNLTDLHDLESNWKTMANVQGNPFWCDCNSSPVKLLARKSSESNIQNIECIHRGNYLSKPLAQLCYTEINADQKISNHSYLIIFVFFLMIFFGGICCLHEMK
ncbi:tsukushi-like [Drosophila eugracilis]|uniref:tsukushi-like n=1 Tax=Drosophila eugracilis TaxID=29029 RepID=UPI0007E86E96|nr:tsukushi-like [Drosophila eugracilis]